MPQAGTVSMFRISPIKLGLKAENMRRRAEARWKSSASEAVSVQRARLMSASMSRKVRPESSGLRSVSEAER